MSNGSVPAVDEIRFGDLEHLRPGTSPQVLHRFQCGPLAQQTWVPDLMYAKYVGQRL